MKPNLVVLRTGPDAAYRQVVDRLAEQNFDVALSWNGTAAPQVPGAAFVHAAPGLRWAGLAQTLAVHQGQWAGYHHVWLPDDGLQWVPEDISRLFTACAQLGLQLAQPAFTPASPGAAPVALQHAGFQLRFTDTVDAAAPVFSRPLLQRVLPQLGQGDARLWARRVPAGLVAVVDATAVARVAAGEASGATAAPAGLNLGGLLDNGDALCFGERASEVAATLQAVMQAAAALPLDGAALSRYLAGHLDLAATAAATLPMQLEQALAGAEMRFNVVLPPSSAPALAAPAAPPPAADAALLDADLRDLRSQHAAVVAERDQLAAALAEVAQQLQQALPAGRPTMARVA